MDPKISFRADARKHRISWHRHFLTFTCLPSRIFWHHVLEKIVPHIARQLLMLLFLNARCCSLYERNCVCAVTKIFTKFLPANNFCQLLRVTHKCSCTSAGNAQAQLHFRDDQQRAFGISNISNCVTVSMDPPLTTNWTTINKNNFPHTHDLWPLVAIHKCGLMILSHINTN